MDRFGQVPVLLPTSLGSAALLATLAVSTVTGAPTAVLLVCSATAGLTYPPMSPAIRSAYRIVLPIRPLGESPSRWTPPRWSCSSSADRCCCRCCSP